MQNEELATQVPSSGRRIKFTPERVQQIGNLVEQGKSREEIAELIGVTIRSLKVTCSRLAIGIAWPHLAKNKTGTRRQLFCGFRFQYLLFFLFYLLSVR